MVFCLCDISFFTGHRCSIGLYCHNYALDLYLVYKISNTQKPLYVTLSRIMIYIYNRDAHYIYIYI